VVIRNHVGGYFYKSEASSRFFYFPETSAGSQGYAHWMPTVWFAGMDEVTGAWTNVYTTWDAYNEKITNWLYVPTPLVIDLDVDYVPRTASGTVHVEVTAETFVGFSDLHLRIALTESDITYSSRHFDQILRDYLPDQNGIAFTIAEGETFRHSEDFVIDSGWDAAECDIVAFVENDAERMVVQCAQAPVPAQTPVVEQEAGEGLPASFRLSQNYPNPFNPQTEIEYTLPRDERVELRIYNVAGAEVAVLADGRRAAGPHSVRWDAGDLASGVYFCRMQAGGVSRTVKMVLMK
jgi:hypothetical protein